MFQSIQTTRTGSTTSGLQLVKNIPYLMPNLPHYVMPLKSLTHESIANCQLHPCHLLNSDSLPCPTTLIKQSIWDKLHLPYNTVCVCTESGRKGNRCKRGVRAIPLPPCLPTGPVSTFQACGCGSGCSPAHTRYINHLYRQC